MLDTFEKLFLATLLKHAPYKKCFSKEKPGARAVQKPWITPALKALIDKKHKLSKIYAAAPTSLNRKLFNQCRNNVNRELKRAHEAYTKTQFDQLHTTKQKWTYINSVRGVTRDRGVVPGLCNSFGELTTDPKKIADLCNVKFSSLGDYSGQRRSHETSNAGRPPRFTFSFVTEQQCIKTRAQRDCAKD